jgi:hypothetical protein
MQPRMYLSWPVRFHTHGSILLKGHEPVPGMVYNLYTECDTLPSLFIMHSWLCTCAQVYGGAVDRRGQEYVRGREREYHTPYCRVQTPFAKYRGQLVQYYTQSVLSNPQTSGLITTTRPSAQP